MEPKNGDFASFLQQTQDKSVQLKQELKHEQDNALQSSDQVDGVLNVSAETLMDDEAVERLAAQMRETQQILDALPPMTDDELDRQALEAGGADNDPDTPE